MLVLSCAALAAVSANAARVGAKVKLRSSHVVQGGTEHLTARVGSRTTEKCLLTVEYADGRKQRLARKRVKAHRVSFTWRVPTNAAVGKAHAFVCQGFAVGVGTFTVKSRLQPASVAVTNSGLSQVPDCCDSGTDVSYGLVLVNRSRDEDAREIQIGVNLLDAAGNAVATDTSYLLGGIPAGGTFYLGGEAETNDSTVVTHLQAFVKVGESAPRSLVAPSVTNVRRSADPVDGTVILNGDVTNNGTADLSDLAEISAVYFNSSGKIVGGGFTYPDFPVPPGAQTAFEIDTLGTPLAGNVAQARVSVDPFRAMPASRRATARDDEARGRRNGRLTSR